MDSGRPFPYISNLSLNLAVLVRDSAAGRMHFARIKVPPILPRFVSFAEDRYFAPLEEVIAANLDQLFPGMEIVEHHTFRVTRNADLEIDDGADDLLEALEEQLAQRRAPPGGAARGRADDPAARARAADERAGGGRRGRLHAARRRSTSRACGACTRSTGPT